MGLGRCHFWVHAHGARSRIFLPIGHVHFLSEVEVFQCPVVFARGGLLVLTVLGTAMPAMAQTVPHALVASPDIYKVIAEDDRYRVIEVTWKAGQRDKPHSHPASAVYYPMDCTLRGFDESGASVGSRLNRAGSARVQDPIPAHAVENAGASDCKLIMFEPK